MTDRAQFEAMLEALINEDQEAAKEIFHNIVVAKSREIYEELLAEDFGSPEEEEEEEGEEEEESDEVGGDETDDFIDDAEGDDESDDEGEEEGDIEDRVLDLEDALEELKAEFEQLMAGEENEPEHDDMFGGEEDEFGGEEDEFGGEEDDMFGGEEEDEMEESPKEIHHFHHNGDQQSQDDLEAFMEYVNKVALPKHGDNGANTRSIVASKNNMGGTTANIVKGGTSETGGTQGGLLKPSTNKMDAGNVNVPGSTKANKLSSVGSGHGAEKKGAKENAANTTSIIGKKVR